MIHGHLSARDTYQFLLPTPAWKLAFDFLSTVTPATPKGRRSLQGDDIYVNVHGYETLPVEKCVFESHRRYVDLQYCITGGETILWSLATELPPNGAYHENDDLQFYPVPAHATTRLRMLPGAFAIFFPSDAHAPKLADGLHPDTFKLVIKIDARLVSGSQAG